MLVSVTRAPFYGAGSDAFYREIDVSPGRMNPIRWPWFACVYLHHTYSSFLTVIWKYLKRGGLMADCGRGGSGRGAVSADDSSGSEACC